MNWESESEGFRRGGGNIRPYDDGRKGAVVEGGY